MIDLSFLVFIFFYAYYAYGEVIMLILYFQLRKKSVIKTVEIISIVREAGWPIYQVQICDNSDKEILILKTTSFTSFVPRIMGRNFKVLVNSENDFCILKNPISFIFSGVILFALYILLFNVF
jgi:hypothetical protein